MERRKERFKLRTSTEDCLSTGSRVGNEMKYLLAGYVIPEAMETGNCPGVWIFVEFVDLESHALSFHGFNGRAS